MDFILFIVVTTILFVRPMDFVPGLEAVPLYYIAITACLLVSWHKIIPRLSSPLHGVHPIPVFAVGMLLVSMLSNLAHGNIERLLEFTPEFGKVLIYLALLIGVVDTSARLRTFLACLVFIDLIPTVLSLLHYHGLVHIPAYEPVEDGTGTASTVLRLRGSGSFADPNDISELLSQGMVFALCFVVDPSSRMVRYLCLGAMPLFGYALFLTHSRGGFLGFVANSAVLFLARFRARRAILLAGLLLLPLLIAFGGRQTSFSTSEGTGQQRIQIWAEGFALMKSSPIWGIGTGEFVEQVKHVAHNSFVHTYTELGFLGGTLYFGMYYYALATLRRLGSRETWIPDSDVARLRPYIMASLFGYAVSELTLTHCYALPTYVLFGIATAWIGLTDPDPSLEPPQLSGRLMVRVVVRSVIFLAAIAAFAEINVRWH